MYSGKGFAPQPPEATGPYDQYQASDIYNDSGVTGDNVKEALDELNAGVGGSTFVEEQFTLIANQISSQRVLLSNVPRLDQNIEFTIWNATPNVINADFAISGSVLSWANTLLSGKLRIDDLISVKYYY